MHFVDRHRLVERVDVVARRRRPRQLARRRRTIEAVSGRTSAAKATGSDFSGSSAPERATISYLYLSPARARRHEDFPIAVAAHPHGVPPAVPEIEIADHADALRIRRQHHEGDAVDAFQRHRMRAELVVEPQLIAFAEQIQIEVGQHRRKPIGVFQLDLVVAEARPQPIVLLAVQRAGKQPGRIDTLELALAAFARPPPRGWHRAETRARRFRRSRYAARDRRRDRRGGRP